MERPAPRLFVEADLGEGDNVTLSAKHTHYLQNVMRLKSGDTVRIFNGRDGEWRGQIASAGKRGMTLAVGDRTLAQRQEPDLWLCCAPIKKAHFEYMVEKAAELGVAALQPILTARTQIREVNAERCRTIATEAAEQSERMSVPAIHAGKTLDALVADWPKGRTPVVCAEWGEATPAKTAFTALGNAPTAIITGPEGGFAREELDKLRGLPGAVFVRLGPRILRADTAAIAALTLWQGLCGDWT